MAKVIGFDEKSYKKFTCYHCCAIVQYAPNELFWAGWITYEGTKIFRLNCPNCNEFVKTGL